MTLTFQSFKIKVKYQTKNDNGTDNNTESHATEKGCLPFEVNRSSVANGTML